MDSRIRQGPPSLEPIRGTPSAEMFIAPEGAQIGLRIFCAAGTLPPSPLVEVAIRCTGAGAGAAVEVTTSNPDLFREFYSFCCDVADRIQLDGEDVGSALTETLRKWVSLLRRKLLMPEALQIGLLGELWLLDRLAATRSWRFAADAWRGPEAEEHDFTFEAIDVEVKTTQLESRVHTIASLTQLLPKKGRPLYVLSIQLTRSAGSKTSMSLPRAVARTLTAATRVAAATASLLRAQIERYGWRDEEAAHYAQEWELRASPSLVPVDRQFPAIVPATLRALGKARMGRIGRVIYDVNLDGLGTLDGSREFSNLLDR